MTISSLNGPALFPVLQAYLDRIVAHGAHPLPQVELNTHVPTLGPYRFDAGLYTLIVTPGPMMRVSVSAGGSGRLLAVA